MANSRITLYEDTPNPLGVTGVVELYDEDDTFYLIKYRKKDNVDPDKIQWSYAGLVSSYLDLNIARKWLSEYGKQLNIRGDLSPIEYASYEIIEEVMMPILLNLKNDNIIDVNKDHIIEFLDSLFNGKAVALILNSKQLFQPELVNYHRIRYDSSNGIHRYIKNNMKYTSITDYMQKKPSLALVHRELIEKIVNEASKDNKSDNHFETRHLFGIIWNIIK